MSAPDIKELTPRRIVVELDRYIVGQDDAKRSVAIAIRNRWRRQQLSPEMRDDVIPKNIIMMGPTGVGKTEIARRLASLVRAPFIKVEASKFTEVGYVGRDVESMIRDLVERSINMVREELLGALQPEARRQAEERVLDALLPPPPARSSLPSTPDAEKGEAEDEQARHEKSRARLKELLAEGKLDEREVEVRVESKSSAPSMDVFSNQGVEHMGFDFQNLFDRLSPSKSVSRKMAVREAIGILQEQEAEKLIDRDKVRAEAVERVQQAGIVFVDEIDKIVGRESGKASGPDVSREGVQRDLLPIVEGSNVQTRHGMVKTDHILFIAAGAFHVSKPADMIPELQGRFPIRVELNPLRREDFLRILTEPKNALTKQYKALLETEGVTVEFTDDSLEAMAELATQVNEQTQNIGARRLHTVFEKLLEDSLFDASERSGETVRVDAAFVREKLGDIADSEDMSRYVL